LRALHGAPQGADANQAGEHRRALKTSVVADLGGS